MPRLPALVMLLLTVGACGEQASPRPTPAAFRVTIRGNPPLGSLENPLPFSTTVERSFTLDIEALRMDSAETVDESYEGVAVLEVRPTGRLTEDPKSVRFVGGRASNVKVGIVRAFGPVRIVAVDAGYAAAAGEPACNNRRDDDGDGYIDYPNDRGCYSGTDDSETGGGNGTGASPLITFANPRIADVQTPGTNKDESGLESTRVTIDQGFMIISRIGVDGMYVTDYDGVRWDAPKNAWALSVEAMSYRSIFAFNFSTPINILEGDCLVQIDGTVEEFFNFTELGKPTWKKGDYAFCAGIAAKAGHPACKKNEADDLAAGSPCRLAMEDLGNTPFPLTKLRVDDGKGTLRSIWDQKYMMTERFESALVQLDDLDLFTELRKCDLNGNGTVDFGDKGESDCSNACGDEPQCQVHETYYRYGQWTASFVDVDGNTVEVNFNTKGSIPKFNPRDTRIIDDTKERTLLRPMKIGKMVGTMRHLGFGRPPWIIEPRRAADCPDCKN